MRGARRFGLSLLSAALVLWGCDQGPGEGTAVEAADFELTVEEVSGWLAPVSELPNDSSIVETILEFWTDYSLLAWTVNQGGLLDDLDISSLVEQEEARALVMRLRDEVVTADTAITETELAEAFEAERPGTAIRARHILLTLPPQPAQAQEDSVRALAEDLRDRAMAGEDFAALAREYSEDTGSAPDGGNLGFFERGEMVAPFEDAAFAMDPGETSGLVASQFGIHIIRVEERSSPTLEESGEEFRAELQRRRLMAAESIYLEEVETPENVEIAEGAYDLVRSITETPDEALGSEGSTALTTYESGEFTAEEYRGFVRGLPLQVRTQITAAPEPQIEQMLRDVTRDQIILTDAEERGITLEPSTTDSIASEIRAQYPEVAEFLQLASIEPTESQTVREAVERAVDELMTRVVANEQDVVPLGSLALPLRDAYDVAFAEDAVTRIVARVEELRAEGAGPGENSGPSAPEPPVRQDAPISIPDTSAPEGGAEPDGDP